MSDKPIPINTSGVPAGFVAPTPQNTPLTTAPIAQGLSKPTVPDIEEDNEGSEGETDDGAAGELTAEELNATMLGMVQGKLAGLIGKSSGYIETLPLPVRKRIEGLKGVHTKYAKLEAEYKREVLDLDRKYSALYRPVFDRRHAILSGDAEPTEEEIETGFKEVTLKDDPEAEPLPAEEDSKDEGADIKGIPQFWLTALRNHPDISSLITERDEEALKSLNDISLEYLTDVAGFKLTFRFGPNDFFTNDVLTKTYYYQQELDYMGDFTYQKAEGTKIDWKGDKDLTQTVEVRKQRNKNTNKTRVVKKTKKTPSFFDFFSPPAQPTDSDQEDMDPDVLDEVEFRLEVDYSVGEDIKERIVPRAIDYFTGKALEYEEDDDEDEDSDDMDGANDEDDEDDDDDVPTKKKGKKGTAPGGGTGECQNQ